MKTGSILLASVLFCLFPRAGYSAECTPKQPGTGVESQLSCLKNTLCQQPDDSMTDQLVSQGSLELSGDALTLSQAYLALGNEPNGPARQRALIRHLLGSLSSYMGTPTVQNMFKKQLGLALPAAQAISLDALTDKTVAALNDPKNQSRLDNLLTLKLSDVKPMQAYLANASKSYTPVADSQVTAYPAKNLTPVKLQSSGCKQDAFDPQPAFGDPAIVTGSEPLADHDSMSPCLSQNSAALAELLNQLSNTVPHTPDKNPSPLSNPVVLSDDTTSGQKIRTNADLLTALAKMGYTLDISTTQDHADFLGLGFKDTDSRGNDRFRPIIAPTSFIDANGKRTIANHGEMNFILYKTDKNGKPGQVAAKLTWYLGIPDSSHQGLSTYWQAATVKRAAWTLPQFENIRTYAPAHLADAQVWLDSAGDLMRGFRQVIQTFHAPANSYGLFICGDSLTMLLERVSHASEDPCLDSVSVKIFPVLRAGPIPIVQDGGKSVDLTGIVTEQAGGIDAGSLAKDYPTSLPVSP